MTKIRIIETADYLGDKVYQIQVKTSWTSYWNAHYEVSTLEQATAMIEKIKDDIIEERRIKKAMEKQIIIHEESI